MLLIDYNGIAIGNISAQKLAIEENLLRHTILTTIVKYRNKFKAYADNTIVICDGGGNWRKDTFPEYKGVRHASRDESTIDWKELFRISDLLLTEMKENLPWKIFKHRGCEADDVIAQLVYNTEEFGKHEDIMIISADKDFIQLQTNKNVKQFSTVTKKLVTDPNPHEYMKNHVLGGDGGDGVPNVLSDDKCFIERRRMVPLTKKKRELLLADPHALGEEVYKNYLRNKKMIDLTQCPEDVKHMIISDYDSYFDEKKNKRKVMTYLTQKRCRMLLEKIEGFM
jgi:hypothetical protein